MIQAGAFGNAFCAIFVNPGRRLLAHANRQLEVGKDYRFRVELDGTRITMAIDGETVLRCEEEIPTRSGYISLYGFYPGKAFADVRVEEGSPANGPTLCDAADAAFLDRRYAEAAGLYARVAETSADAPIGQRALYRKGLAEWSAGDGAAAGRTWSLVSDPGLATRIACVRLEEVLNTGLMTPHQSAFEVRYRDQPAMREQLRQAWRMILQQQLDAAEPDRVIVDYFLGLRSSLFPEDEASRYVAAVTLLACHRYEDILRDFPDQRMACARSLLALGRTQQILDTPWIGNDEHNHAMGMRGDFAGMLQMPGLMPAWRARALIRCGRAAEAARDPEVAYPTLLFLGRAGELLEDEHLSGTVANEALVCLGRLREAAGEGLAKVPGSGSSITAMLMLGQVDLAERVSGHPRPAIRFMQAAETGDDQAYARLHDQIVLPVDLAGNTGWFAPLVMRPFVDAMHGDPAAVERDIRPRLDLLSGIYARTGWFVARAVLGDTPPEAVLEMPAVPEREAWRAVAAGVRAELVGKPADARTAYEAFTALPIPRRLLNLTQPDPDVEWFVAWRLRALAKAGP